MTLTLRIDNFDTLDDGGPVWITLDQRGASIGRRPSMDWVLPDPAKHVSGHHFDIQYNDGAYWLRDVSTNGTYLQGSHHRIDGAHHLQGGERLIVGHYVISATLSAGAGAGGQPQPTPVQAQGGGYAAAADDSDPWDLSGEALQPVNPLPPRAANPHHLDEMGQELVPLQRPSNPSPMDARAAPVQQPGFAGTPRENVQHPPQHPTSAVPISTPQMPPQQAPVPSPVAAPPPQQPRPPQAPQSIPQSPVAAPATPTPLQQPAPASTQNAPAPDAAQAVIEAFCRGAGIPPQAAEGIDMLELVEMLGKTTRQSVDEIMVMIKDRSTVKKETRGGERTMTGAMGNNPMKFLPDAEQAFAALFLQHRQGFMKGPEGFSNALSDLRRHQTAIFAAIQPALAELLSGLSPDAIEDREDGAGNLLSGSRKGRNWEAFVERWDEKASAGEHGMLDAFFKAFARAYTDINRKGDQGP